MTTVKIQGSIKDIESFAFYGCNSLASIKIPKRVKDIGASAFYGCENADIVIDNYEKDVKFYDYDGYKVSKEESRAFKGCKSVRFRK